MAADGTPVSEIQPSATLTLRIVLRALSEVDVCSVGVLIARADGTHLYEVHTTWQGVGVGPLVAEQDATVDVRFSAHLLAGHYTIAVSVTDLTGRETWAVAADAARFDVAPAPGGAGLVDLAAATSVSDGPAVRLGDGTGGSVTGPIPLPRLQRRRAQG